MSYEYPFDDDREVTVGDLRRILQVLKVMFACFAGYVFYALGVVAYLAGHSFGTLLFMLAFVFFMGEAWVRASDGRVRKLYSRFREFDAPPLSVGELGMSREALPRGDD